jgi:hypothetical protein
MVVSPATEFVRDVTIVNYATEFVRVATVVSHATALVTVVIPVTLTAMADAILKMGVVQIVRVVVLHVTVVATLHAMDVTLPVNQQMKAVLVV